MRTDEFDYDLPSELIAQRPKARGNSRLLLLDATGECRHRWIRDLPQLLSPGDLLVVNNTKVIPARLFAVRESSGGRVELLLLEKLAKQDWTTLAKPGRRLRAGTLLRLQDEIEATVIARLEDGRHRVRFSEPIEPHLDRLGHVPLPPYIKRPDRAADRSDYQTVFANSPGAVAAPTAGLHFSTELLHQIRAAGIGIAELTLHVGLGTFKPVSATRVHEHRMESERFELPEQTAAAVNRTRQLGGRIVAVGTTSVRALEAAARKGQGRLAAAASRTDLFITPGFRFQVVDVLLTNFHLPRSTLLMLVCAFAGRERILQAYARAIAERYRFYSYGDAMLIERQR
jgi:S-adenosylmethionine:tRNA ribosyltransferase-isomerase